MVLMPISDAHFRDQTMTVRRTEGLQVGVGIIEVIPVLVIDVELYEILRDEAAALAALTEMDPVWVGPAEATFSAA